MSDGAQPFPAHTVHVYEASALRVRRGVNLRDAIAEAAACEPGDVYRLDPAARAWRMLLRPAADRQPHAAIAEGSEIGAPGERVDLVSLFTLMTEDGERLELLFARHAASGAGIALPLSPITPGADYTLLAATEDFGDMRIADVVCVSFGAGTMVTLPGGSQRPIESLAPGDQVLTRDHGPQPVRWIGRSTMRANGAFAPVVITAGTLGNAGDLVVSPHHRVFLYQRGVHRVGGVAEILVQAKHLVDGEAVVRREGGFVDYYSLVFDRHEIIYAEGIPAESLMVNEATTGHLPPDLAEEIRARFPGLNQHQHFGTEAGRELLDEAARAALLARYRQG
ncbi:MULTISPECIES: Hint domain-containing protein [Albidovulum]|nr:MULTISPECIES: Hint domain-containing protein [Defluviimonas]MCW3780902.1 Hint domain-containing protein [Defluviimonas salinarum]